MERRVMAGPDFGRRSSDGYKRVMEPRSLGCPETPLARLAVDAGLGIRHASLHSPVTWAFAVAHTDRKWPSPVGSGTRCSCVQVLWQGLGAGAPRRHDRGRSASAPAWDG